MNTLVVVGGTDITPYIDWGNYKMQRKDVYTSWSDGNFVEHRTYIRTNMAGSFRVWLCGINGMDTDAFLDLWESATHNHITSMSVYDQASNSMKAIQAYCEIVPDRHEQMMNGDYFDTFTIKVEER